MCWRPSLGYGPAHDLATAIRLLLGYLQRFDIFFTSWMKIVAAVRDLLQRAHYAQPGLKKKVDTRVAVKQQLRKRFKEASAAARGPAPVTQKEALTEALFAVPSEARPTQSAEVLEQRAVISKAWSRLQMLRVQAQSSWERAFLQSKLRAMAALEEVSPELAEAARGIDYSIPPTHRRIPTETPPDPAKFPFGMTVTEPTLNADKGSDHRQTIHH